MLVRADGDLPADIVKARRSLSVSNVRTPDVAAFLPAPASSRAVAVAALLPGLLVCTALAAVATVLGRLAPVIGAPVFGIALGMLLGVVGRGHAQDQLRPGIVFASRGLLQLSIVVLGAGLSLTQIAHTGLTSLPVLLGTLSLALAVAWGAGRLLGITWELRTLIGVGTAICGASAIAATTAVIDADESDVTYAISTIFAFNVIAVVTYPTIGHLLGMSQHAFGLWAGTAVNDTSSVVAAAYTYGPGAGDFGVIVKLTRTLMIIPIAVALALWMSRRDAGTTVADQKESGPRRRLRLTRLVPWFLVGFGLAASLNSLGIIPHEAHAPLSSLSLFLITVALSAIGLSTRLLHLRRSGLRPLALGAILWATVGVSSLVIQGVSGMR